MMVNKRESVVILFAVEIDGRISYRLNFSEWDYENMDIVRNYTSIVILNEKISERNVDYFCSTVGAKTIILVGLDYIPSTLTTKYTVYKYLMSEDKLVPVK